uniref:U1 small nuclear ribonucleoprotein C n=1 Tax=Xiphophorus couchianus TaxID=32473 RepID=A0A3B5MP06_9TELE
MDGGSSRGGGPLSVKSEASFSHNDQLNNNNNKRQCAWHEQGGTTFDVATVRASLATSSVAICGHLFIVHLFQLTRHFLVCLFHRFYCDYCDTYLTHDSPSVRKTHCSGRKHKENVKDYYQKWMEEQAQSLIDKTSSFILIKQQHISKSCNLLFTYVAVCMLPTPPMGGPPMMPMMGPPPHGMMPGGPGKEQLPLKHLWPFQGFNFTLKNQGFFFFLFCEIFFLSPHNSQVCVHSLRHLKRS